ncbi:E3 ubiquitin-protein ligase mib2-like isoform x2 [Plakobranchus ocellatus]|uniref:E3 ubiquitin-protein ligase mib2-like isoform x2 n=1 Tax=Plakobranchus ocellatus TaxID=259542 RepID=A0AAV3ZFN4_9GAST|nr:E3 ubiquitin-protein ligase mib2-like isoform x2 [Plakobranchus ocellatus]
MAGLEPATEGSLQISGRNPKPEEELIICHKLNLNGYGDQTGAAIACFLVRHGAELQAHNKQVKTSLDITTDSKIEEVVQQFIAAFAKKEEQASKPSTATLDDCCAKSPLVTFHPCNHSVGLQGEQHQVEEMYRV